MRYKYNNLSFDVPNLNSNGITFFPNKINITIPNNGNTWKYSSNQWDLDCFNTLQIPTKLGKIGNEFSYSSGVRILDMPIKMPHSNKYSIPKELKQWYSVIKRIIELEHHFNSYIDKYYAYITIDQGYVKKGMTQRHEGCHVDGFQGGRIKNKNSINRSYIISDVDTTLIYNQKFKVNLLDENKHDFFKELELQSNKNNIWQPEPYEIVLMNVYTVHKAAIAKSDGYRTFFRISYDVREFDRLGNTHNPMFDYNWNMVHRNVYKNLTQYR